MLASHNWLLELSGVTAEPADVAERLTSLGLEVEDVTAFGQGLAHVVIAEVRAVEKVEGKDKLNLVTVFDGEGDRQVICGAPNVPKPGGRVVLAKPGAVLPGDFAIAERAVGGITSSGMLCSETELGIGEGTEGILVLTPADPGKPGQLAAEALKLVDHVYEIGLTPNRPDCLGHVGLARELALAFDVPFRTPKPGFPTRLLSVPGDGDATHIELLAAEGAPPVDTLTLVEPKPGLPVEVPIRVDAPEGCPRYGGCVIQGVVVAASPFWLRYRLFVLGLRSIDNVVDITNLVLLEQGHPIHAFDLAHVRGAEIVVRSATAGETMATLDGETREFTADDLLICDGQGPVAVAGVMGGADSEIRKQTTDVFLEVAYFDPPTVRRTSRRLGMHTDSSHRFERGVDPNAIPRVLRRTTGLLCSLAGGAVSPTALDVYPAPIAPKQVQFDPAHVERLLGAPITDAQSRRALEAIGCTISPGETDGWRVTCPTWRPDLTRPEDLVEEVGRIVGYDAIPTELPRVLPSGRGVATPLRVARRLRETAASLGLLEAVNYSFVSRSDLERSGTASPDAVELANPLSEERSVMRTTLLPGMLDAIGRARRHQTPSVALFELARVYSGAGGEVSERPVLAVALAGPRQDHVGPGDAYDFYDLKGFVLALLSGALGFDTKTAHADPPASYFHPRRAAAVQLAGSDETLGWLGEIHPEVGDSFDLDVRVQYAELSLEAILAELERRGPPKARALPRFPSVSRDVALVVEESQQVAAIAEALREAGGPLLEAVELFDVYRGESIPEGHKSVAFRVVYRQADKTLTDKLVDKAHRAVLAAADQQLGAAVRA